MNALSLYHGLKKRGVILAASPDGEHLKVDAPAGVLTKEDREGLRKFKAMLLRLSRASERAQAAVDDDRRFDARPSHHPGYTSLYDPVDDEWHDFPTKDCYPSVLSLANRRREKGGVA